MQTATNETTLLENKTVTCHAFYKQRKILGIIHKNF